MPKNNATHSDKWGAFGAVRSHLRSKEIAAFDTAHTSFYYRSVLTMSLSCTVSEI